MFFITSHRINIASTSHQHRINIASSASLCVWWLAHSKTKLLLLRWFAYTVFSFVFRGSTGRCPTWVATGRAWFASWSSRLCRSFMIWTASTPRFFRRVTKEARCFRCVENFSMCPDSPRFFRRVTKEARAIGRVEKFSTCPKSQRNGRHMTKKASAVGSAPKIPTRVSSEYPTSWVTFRILHQNSSRNVRHLPRCTFRENERFPDFLDFSVFFAIFSQGERTRRLRF